MWVVFIGVFFSISDSKLIPYVLPALPALALAIVATPLRTLHRDLLVATLVTGTVALALGIASVYGPAWLAANERNRYFALLAQPLVEIAALLAVSALFVLVQRRRDVTRSSVILGVGWCLAGVLLMRGAGVVAPVYSGIVLARALGTVPRDEPIYSVATYDQSVPFYAQRTLTLVAYRGELEFGLQHDPGAELAHVEDFVAQWQTLPQAYAVMETSTFDDLHGRGVPMREIARDVHRVLVTRR